MNNIIKYLERKIVDGLRLGADTSELEKCMLEALTNLEINKPQPSPIFKPFM